MDTLDLVDIINHDGEMVERKVVYENNISKMRDSADAMQSAILKSNQAILTLQKKLADLKDDNLQSDLKQEEIGTLFELKEKLNSMQADELAQLYSAKFAALSYAASNKALMVTHAFNLNEVADDIEKLKKDKLQEGVQAIESGLSYSIPVHVTIVGGESDVTADEVIEAEDETTQQKLAVLKTEQARLTKEEALDKQAYKEAQKDVERMNSMIHDLSIEWPGKEVDVDKVKKV